MAIDVIEKDRKEIRWLGLSNETTNELSAIEVYKIIIKSPLHHSFFLLLERAWKYAEEGGGEAENFERSCSAKNCPSQLDQPK